MVKASCTGLFNINAGYIASLDVIKGGEFNSLRWDQKPRMVDIKITISDLYNTMVAIDNKKAQNKYIERPTLKNYLATLSENPEKRLEPIVIDPAGRGNGGGVSPNPTGYSSNYVTLSDEELLEEQSILKFDKDPIRKRMPKERILPAGQLPNYEINRTLVDDTPEKSDILKKTDKDSSDSISNYTTSFNNSINTIKNDMDNTFETFNNNFKTISNKQTILQTYVNKVSKNISDYNISSILLTNFTTYESSLDYYNLLKENTNKLKNNVSSLKSMSITYFDELETEFQNLLSNLNITVEDYLLENLILDNVSIFLFLDDDINYPSQIKSSLGIDITQSDMNRLKNMLYSNMTNLVATFNTKVNVKIESNYLSSNYIAKDIRDYINDVCITRINNRLYDIRDFYLEEIIEYTELLDSLNTLFKSLMLGYIQTLEEFIVVIEEELSNINSYNTSIYTFERYKDNLLRESTILLTSLLTDLTNTTTPMKNSLINEMSTLSEKNKTIRRKNNINEKENEEHIKKIGVLFSLINRTLDMFRTILQDYIFNNNTY